MSPVQQVIAKLLTDVAFREGVQANPEAALQEYHLTAEEQGVVTQLELDKWDTGGDEMLAAIPDIGRRITRY